MIDLVLSPGRYDRPLATLAASVTRLQDIGAVIVHTEQAGRSAAREQLFRRALWSFFHAAGAGPGECLIQWAPHLALAGQPIAPRLSSLFYWRVGGAQTPLFHAALVPLVDQTSGRVIVVIAAHLPTRRTARRRAVWRSCMRGLVRQVKAARVRYPGCAIAVAADFNVDHRTDRALVGRYLEPLALRDAWAGREPIAGTHGRRLIDAVWTDVPVDRCQLTVDDPSSDHRPMRARLGPISRR